MNLRRRKTTPSSAFGTFSPEAGEKAPRSNRINLPKNNT